MKIGKIPENIWKRSIKKSIEYHTLDDDGAGIGRNTACYKTSAGSFCVSEDCLIPFCGQMGSLAVYEAVNAAAAMSDNILGINISLMTDGKCSEEMAAHIAKDAGKAAAKLCIPISSFEVHTIRSLRKPYILAGAAAEVTEAVKRALPDRSIVVAGNIGMAGTVILADNGMEELLTRFSREYTDKAIDVCSRVDAREIIRICRKTGAEYIRPLSETGIFGGLWEMSQTEDVGFDVYIKNIPILQETVEVANFFDVNPYEMLSTGAVLATVKDADALTNALMTAGISAYVIGSTNKSNDKLIINEDEKRFLTAPGQDPIWRD